MASLNFMLRGAKNPSQVYFRFSGTGIDFFIKTGIYVDPKCWDKKNQKIKNVISIKNRDEINRKIAYFKIEVLDNFNSDFMNGTIIDRVWFDNQVRLFFNRPKEEIRLTNKNHTIYLVDFCQWWLDNKANRWLTSSDEYMSKGVKNQYSIFVDKLVNFEGKTKIKLTGDLHSVINDFVKKMIDESYSPATISRNVKRFKFFCNRASDEGLKIDSSYKGRVFVPKQKEILEPFLSPRELAKVYNLKLDISDPMDDARDNLLIGCWSGLRVSDFNSRLDISNFIDDYIEIINQKTKARVSIPVHPVIKQILIKRNGRLPKKTSDKDFNEKIKVISKLCGFKEMMEGRLVDPSVNRKVQGVYEKYKLVSSHICRRSFVTNHLGKVPNEDLMRIGGWTTVEMMMTYLKRTSREHGKSLIEVWSKDEELNKLINGK
ncbi:hypothetical protein [Wenyingzhuangia sp. 2_MG-2023]|uniref:hypothetical protein n=1 Tax=Wenyingzhuangia sp. 2_MG-2023 TaxID=3062639 RepID=UPI0026E1CFC8|nr:hypothetical protein [Wenyingzhuangia sp. 2_MG-2023]MDO6737051.1 hypothetical protein [Wenyingzhuangia sp. 2_MG-2023]